MGTKSLIKIALLCALIAIGAFIKIPFLFVPMTLQTLFVLMAGLTLTKAEAISSVGLYLGLGLMGFPVFTNGGGLSYVLKPTFGYLLGFLLCVYLMTTLKAKVQNKLVLALLGMSLIHVVGIAYFLCMQSYYFNKSFELDWIVMNLVLIFLPKDILTCVIASEASKRIGNDKNKNQMED